MEYPESREQVWKSDQFLYKFYQKKVISTIKLVSLPDKVRGSRLSAVGPGIGFVEKRFVRRWKKKSSHLAIGNI